MEGIMLDGISGNMAALQQLALKALTQSLDAMESAATTLVAGDAPSSSGSEVPVEGLGENIDLKA
jgi:hypothetical protein